MLKKILFSSVLISTSLASDGVYAMNEQDTIISPRNTLKLKLDSQYFETAGENVRKEIIKLFLSSPFLDFSSLAPQDFFEKGLSYLKQDTPKSTRIGVQYWAMAGLSPAGGYYFLADMYSHGGGDKKRSRKGS